MNSFVCRTAPFAVIAFAVFGSIPSVDVANFLVLGVGESVYAAIRYPGATCAWTPFEYIPQVAMFIAVCFMLPGLTLALVVARGRIRIAGSTPIVLILLFSGLLWGFFSVFLAIECLNIEILS